MELLEDRRVLAIFVVDTTIDTVDVNLGDGVAADIDGMTSLRAAVMEANALTGDDTINLPDGTYVLTLASVVPLDSTDLDVTDTTGNLTIAGAAAATTIIDGNQSDRVIHVLSVASLALSDVTLTRGLISFEDGAGLFMSAMWDLSPSQRIRACRRETMVSSRMISALLSRPMTTSSRPSGISFPAPEPSIILSDGIANSCIKEVTNQSTG